MKTSQLKVNKKIILALKAMKPHRKQMECLGGGFAKMQILIQIME